MQSLNPNQISLELEPKINLGDNLRIAMKTVGRSIAKEKSIIWKVIKAGSAFVGGIVITAMAVGLTCLAALSFILAFPVVMTLRGWSRQNMKDYYSSSVKETAAFFITSITNPINGIQFNPEPLAPGQQTEKTPILCVNGYLHNSSAWHFMREKLEKEGAGPIYTISVGNPVESIKNKANRVKKLAEKIAKETGRNDLVLIGHSMGGLVSSEYASNLAPENTVKGIITLGSPLQGTHIAKIGIGQAAREMGKKSSFVKQLQENIDKTAQKVKFYHFGSKTDLIVSGSSAINVKSNKEKNSDGFRHEYSSCGHASFLYSEDVAKHVVLAYKDATI